MIVAVDPESVGLRRKNRLIRRNDGVICKHIVARPFCSIMLFRDQTFVGI